MRFDYGSTVGNIAINNNAVKNNGIKLGIYTYPLAFFCSISSSNISSSVLYLQSYLHSDRHS